jgi:hypothetical protein
MPSKKPARDKRTYRLPVLLTTAEKKELREAAAADQGSQVSVGDYVRTAALEKARRGKPR